MIASVRGTVTHVGLDSAVLEVGGVGLVLHVTPATAASLRTGAPGELATSLVVREDSLTLFGFANSDERALFELVQTVSGVGPRLALAMLAVHSPDHLRLAIATGDLTTLTKVPGIGRKGAERIVLELRDKIGQVGTGGQTGGVPGAAGGATGPGGVPRWRDQVTQALVGLGWNLKAADGALDRLAEDLGPDPDVAVALRSALRELGR